MRSLSFKSRERDSLLGALLDQAAEAEEERETKSMTVVPGSTLLPANEVLPTMSSPPPKEVIDILSPGDSKDLDLQQAIKNSLGVTGYVQEAIGNDEDILRALAELESETEKVRDALKTTTDVGARLYLTCCHLRCSSAKSTSKRSP